MSFLKAPRYQDGRPANSDPADEQNFLVNTINKLQHSKDWMAPGVARGGRSTHTSGMTRVEPRARIEVVALVASAGGLEALSVVLRSLPADLPAGIVVQQHLGGQASVLPIVLERRLGRSVGWAEDGRRSSFPVG